MTVTLNGGIGASAIHLRVNAAVADPAPYYQIGSEVLRVESYFENEADGALKLVPNYTRWTVARGQVGTVKATHADGATLTPLYPQVGNPAIDTGGGAAALSLDNTIDPPSDITSLVAAGATVVGSEATLRGKDFYAQDTDPGAVGVGSVWKDTTTGVFWTRNGTDDGWEALFRPQVVATGSDPADVASTAQSVDGDANAGATATTSGSGPAAAGATATASGTGDASAGPTAISVDGDANAGAIAIAGDGAANVKATATVHGTGDATAGSVATADSGGDAEAKSVATATGAGDAKTWVSSTTVDGDAESPIRATATGTGDADTTATSTTLTGKAEAGVKATRDATTIALLVEVDATGLAQMTAIGLPTSDPVVAGAIWLNAGVMTVSAG